MNTSLAASALGLGVFSVAVIMVAPRMGPVESLDGVLWIVPSVAIVAGLTYVAGAVLLPVFWLLGYFGKKGWRFYVPIGALAGAALGVLMAWLDRVAGLWIVCAVCAAAGATSGAIFSLALCRVYKPIAGTVLTACLAMCAAPFVPDAWMYPSQFRDAYGVIGRIEEFRQAQGHLPVSLEEIGRSDDERGPLYYKLSSEDRYRVWFSAPGYGSFGALSYDSKAKTWQGGD